MRRQLLQTLRATTLTAQTFLRRPLLTSSASRVDTPAVGHHLLRSHPPPAHLDYLHQLSASLSTNQLSQSSLSQALNYLKSNGLFSSLSPSTLSLLLDYKPTSPEDEDSPSTHYYLYNRIFFLLDRIYELKHLFTRAELDQFHSISLKQFSQLGLFRPAELIWDQLILPHSSPSQPHPQDQMLMVDCIRTAFSNYQSLKIPSENNQEHQNQDLLPLTPKDTRRMVKLSQSLGDSLISSAKLNPVAERWIVRAVAEIFGIQTETSKLSRWLVKTRALDLEFPDQGASWTDPKLTAIVVKMFKDQGNLESMITIYEAACHPSASMLSHPQTKAMEEKAVFDSGMAVCLSNASTPNEQRKRNPILTRTYHDLILAATHANRPHLAIHFLTQAIERNELHVQNLLLKHASSLNFPPVPALRLQPATFSELIPNLVRKKRDTQLKTLLELTHRLVRSTVEELNFIRTLALNRSSAFPNEKPKWQTILDSIVPNLNSEHERNNDLELEKSQNLMLEKIVFTHNNEPSKFFSAATEARDEMEHKDQDTQVVAQSSDSDVSKKTESQLEEEIKFLRVLERTKFLSKSLIHSIKLIRRLDPMIYKTKINRALRFESNLLKQKTKSISQKTSKTDNNRHQPFFIQNPPPASSNPLVSRVQNRIEILKLQKKNVKQFNSDS